MLERSFRNLVVKWQRRTVNESGDSIEDSSKGGLGRCESAGPSTAPGRNVGSDSSDSIDEEDPERDPERKIKETKTQRRV